MPLLLPKQRAVRRQANMTSRPAPNTWGTDLTSDATANAEPATPTELIASTSFDTDLVVIRFGANSGSATRSDSLVNIKIGGSGSEVTIIPDLFAGWTASGNAYTLYEFPLRIPAGTRISATHRSSRTSTTVNCWIELYGGGDGLHWAGTGVEAVGATEASSRGTSVTPGTTSDGTLTSIGTNTYDWGYVLPYQSSNADTTLTAQMMVFDLASGSSTADVIPGLEDFLQTSNSVEFYVPNTYGRYCHIPAGTTLYVRAQYGGVSEAKDWIVYGVF